MATGHILYLGLHVAGLMKSADRTQANNSHYRRRIRSFWAYFSVDRYDNGQADRTIFHGLRHVLLKADFFADF